MDMHLDTSWCPGCDGLILPKRYTITVPQVQPPSSSTNPAIRQSQTTRGKHGTIRAKHPAVVHHHQQQQQPPLVKLRTVIDQGPTPLYCSEECRIKDMHAMGLEDFDVVPPSHSSSSQQLQQLQVQELFIPYALSRPSFRPSSRPSSRIGHCSTGTKAMGTKSSKTSRRSSYQNLENARQDEYAHSKNTNGDTGGTGHESQSITHRQAALDPEEREERELLSTHPNLLNPAPRSPPAPIAQPNQSHQPHHSSQQRERHQAQGEREEMTGRRDSRDSTETYSTLSSKSSGSTSMSKSSGSPSNSHSHAHSDKLRRSESSQSILTLRQVVQGLPTTTNGGYSPRKGFSAGLSTKKGEKGEKNEHTDTHTHTRSASTGEGLMRAARMVGAMFSTGGRWGSQGQAQSTAQNQARANASANGKEQEKEDAMPRMSTEEPTSAEQTQEEQEEHIPSVSPSPPSAVAGAAASTSISNAFALALARPTQAPVSSSTTAPAPAVQAQPGRPQQQPTHQHRRRNHHPPYSFSISSPYSICSNPPPNTPTYYQLQMQSHMVSSSPQLHSPNNAYVYPDGHPVPSSSPSHAYPYLSSPSDHDHSSNDHSPPSSNHYTSTAYPGAYPNQSYRPSLGPANMDDAEWQEMLRQYEEELMKEDGRLSMFGSVGALAMLASPTGREVGGREGPTAGVSLNEESDGRSGQGEVVGSPSASAVSVRSGSTNGNGRAGARMASTPRRGSSSSSRSLSLMKPSMSLGSMAGMAGSLRCEAVVGVTLTVAQAVLPDQANAGGVLASKSTALVISSNVSLGTLTSPSAYSAGTGTGNSTATSNGTNGSNTTPKAMRKPLVRPEMKNMILVPDVLTRPRPRLAVARVASASGVQGQGQNNFYVNKATNVGYGPQHGLDRRNPYAKKDEDKVEMPLYPVMPPLPIYERRIERSFIPDSVEEVMKAQSEAPKGIEGGGEKRRKRNKPPRDEGPLILRVLASKTESTVGVGPASDPNPSVNGNGNGNRMKTTSGQTPTNNSETTLASNTTQVLSLHPQRSSPSSSSSSSNPTNHDMSKLQQNLQMTSTSTTTSTGTSASQSQSQSLLQSKLTRTSKLAMLVSRLTRSLGDVETSRKEVREIGRERGQKRGWPGVWVDMEVEVEVIPERKRLFLFAEPA